MENVNNLNGVPNFGHGWDDEQPVPLPKEVIPTEEATPSVDEEEIEPNTEDTVKSYGKSKRTAK